jgi:5-hydroxyisourate hydrolase
VSATISTHVLDATTGVPAAAVPVILERRLPAGGWATAGRGSTDADGRLRFAEALEEGTFRLTFGTGDYFAALGVPSFYPEVTVTFTVVAGHYHVPLLLSPYAYSTYRGS